MTTEFTTTESQEPESDKDRNFRALETKAKAQEAELNELRPLREREALREAGFDPDSDRGKAIRNAIKVRRADGDDVDLSAEGIQELAVTEYGYKPQASLSADESSRQDAQGRVESLRTGSEPEREVTLDEQIAEAEAAGDYARSGILKLQKLTNG
jgi:hypothetical protein